MSEAALTSGRSAELAAGLSAPWLQPPFEQLHRARRAGRLPAALLIHEQRGAGGQALALRIAQLALCKAPAAPCGVCRDCRWMQAGQHPDFIDVTPVGDSRLIRVEQVRELCEQLALTSHGGHATVALIAPADTLNANAANALLKTLEEPRPGVTLILVTALPSRLPATLLSRCQRFSLPAPPREQAVAWLEQQRGPASWAEVLAVLGDAAFEALAAEPALIAQLRRETERTMEELLCGRGEISRIAEAWGRAESFELRLACLENWLTARIDSALQGESRARELRSGTHSGRSATDLNMAKLLQTLEAVYGLRQLRLSSINRPLALEELLWVFIDAGRDVDYRGVVRGEHDQGPQFPHRYQ